MSEVCWSCNDSFRCADVPILDCSLRVGTGLMGFVVETFWSVLRLVCVLQGGVCCMLVGPFGYICFFVFVVAGGKWSTVLSRRVQPPFGRRRQSRIASRGHSITVSICYLPQNDELLRKTHAIVYRRGQQCGVLSESQEYKYSRPTQEAFWER